MGLSCTNKPYNANPCIRLQSSDCPSSRTAGPAESLINKTDEKEKMLQIAYFSRISRTWGSDMESCYKRSWKFVAGAVVKWGKRFDRNNRRRQNQKGTQCFRVPTTVLHYDLIPPHLSAAINNEARVHRLHCDVNLRRDGIRPMSTAPQSEDLGEKL